MPTTAPEQPLLPPAPQRQMASNVYPVVADTWAAAIGPWTVQLNVVTRWVATQVNAAEEYKIAAASSAIAADESARSAAKSAGDATSNGAAQVDLAKQQVTLATQQAQLAKTNGAEQVALAAQQAQLATSNGNAQVQLAAQKVAQAEVIKTDTGKIRDSTQVLADAVQTTAGFPSYINKQGWVITVKEDGSGVEWRPRHRIGEVVQAAGSVSNTFLPMTGGLYLQSAYPELFSKVGLLGAIAGDSWTSLSTTAPQLTNMRSGQDGVLIAHKGVQGSTLYRSVDKGANWVEMDLTAAVGSATAVPLAMATDKKGVWVVSFSSGNAVRSADNGLTWVKITIGSSAYQGDLSTDGNGVWLSIGGSSVTNVTRSVDNGLTWKFIVGIGSFSGGVSVGDGNGNWYVTTSARVYKSTDNGLTFSSVYSGNGGAIKGLLFSRGLLIAYCAAAGSTSAVIKSADGGSSWLGIAAPGYSIIPEGFSGTTDGADAWYIGLATGRILRSVDNTETWEVLTAAKTGFTGNDDTVRALATSGADLVAAANAASTAAVGKVRLSLASLPYDGATLFKLPSLPSYKGITSFIKAKEAA